MKHYVLIYITKQFLSNENQWMMEKWSLFSFLHILFFYFNFCAYLKYNS